MPLVDDLIQQGGMRGIEEMVIGMAHRGRLNLLVNVVGKSPQKLFSEFEGHYDVNHMQGSGDVKYHKGFSTDIKTPAGNVHVAMAFNPSHLEVREPGRRRLGACSPAAPQRHQGRQGRSAADSRRRRLRGPGRRA